MYLPYSHWESYKSCPQKYFWTYREKRVPSKSESSHNAVYGTVIQKAMEVFFNTRIYLTDKSLWFDWFLDFIKNNFDKIIAGELDVVYDQTTGEIKNRAMKIDWGQATLKKEGVISLCISTVPILIEILDKNPFLLTTKMSSEMELKAKVLDGDHITGKLDFIIEDEKISIFDGKSNKDPKDVKKEQLLYYALVYYLSTGKLPDQLGFIFWRYATVETFPVILEDVLNLKTDIENVLNLIKAEKFEATPNEAACQWCKYSSECLERISYRANKKSAKSNNNFDLIENGDHFNVMF